MFCDRKEKMIRVIRDNIFIYPDHIFHRTSLLIVIANTISLAYYVIAWIDVWYSVSDSRLPTWMMQIRNTSSIQHITSCSGKLSPSGIYNKESNNPTLYRIIMEGETKRVEESDDRTVQIPSEKSGKRVSSEKAPKSNVNIMFQSHPHLYHNSTANMPSWSATPSRVSDLSSNSRSCAIHQGLFKFHWTLFAVIYWWDTQLFLPTSIAISS